MKLNIADPYISNVELNELVNGSRGLKLLGNFSEGNVKFSR